MMQSALEAQELELQTLPGLAAENATLRTKASCLRDSVETLGRERKEVVTLTQTVRDLTAHSMKFRPDAELLRKWNMELASYVQNKLAHVTVESARLKAVAEEWASVKPKLTASHFGSVNSCWGAHSAARNASKVEEDVINALMVVSGRLSTRLNKRFLSLAWN